MTRVSTNFTLLLKIFLPTLWIVFFGLMTIVFWFQDNLPMGTVPIEYLRIGMTIFFIIGVTLLYFSVFKLLRVEMDTHFVYATNYWNTARYPFHQIESIEEKDYLVISTIHINLKQKGIFGKNLVFIPSKVRFQNFLNDHPHVVDQFQLVAKND